MFEGIHWLKHAPADRPRAQGVLRANLIGTVMDIAIGTLLAAVIIGRVSLPAIMAVTTEGWDIYSVLLWGLLPLVVVAALLTAIYNRAKFAYSMGGQGGMS